MEHCSWGPAYDEAAVRAALAAGIPESGGKDGVWGDRGEIRIETIRSEDLAAATAAAIADGEVVGWYQGRSEWGPRALGNRSILADPRRADMKELLNRKIKRRESFRPFAPSILEERTGDWFTCSYPDPFMVKVYPIRPEKRAEVPAVTHADGTGRLQTVSQRANPRYWALIRAFEERTGVPMVLNTSFNENEPIVNTPAEALNCFLRTRMDRLVLGDVTLTRSWRSEPNAQSHPFPQLPPAHPAAPRPLGVADDPGHPLDVPDRGDWPAPPPPAAQPFALAARAAGERGLPVRRAAPLRPPGRRGLRHRSESRPLCPPSRLDPPRGPGGQLRAGGGEPRAADREPGARRHRGPGDPDAHGARRRGRHRRVPGRRHAVGVGNAEQG